ncbi:MAG: SDR family NAD(P)-dependent oxidoreductase [Solirubrobacteraceae bacterium]
MTIASSPSALGRRARHRSAARRVRPGAVVVTGASTGIGRATAEHLAALGYRVIAGIRDPRAADELSRVSPMIEPFLLDIRDDDAIAELVEFVERTEPGGLTALVNNAGVGAVGPTETLELEAWRSVFEVNVIGTVAVTRALLPSLLACGGRVVTIGSAAGRIGFPLFGPYVASKFALEGVNDVLRREVEAHGVKVICVEPGVVRSAIYDRGLAESYERTARLDDAQVTRYGALLASAHAAAEETRVSGRPAAAVAPTIARAIRARRPRTRYVSGWDARTAVVCSRILPDRVCDAVIRRLTR